MKRTVLAVGAILSTGGVALAAPDCDAGSTPVGSTQTFIIGGALDVYSFGPTSASCSVSNVLDSGGADRYVVYQTNIRGTAYSEADSSVTVTEDGPDGPRSVTYTDTEVPTFNITRRYAAGFEPSSGFSADYSTLLDGAENGELYIDDITVAVAWTTKAEQQDSLSQVGQQQVGLLTHLDGMNSLLIGGNLALEGEDEIGVLGGYGSYMVGVTGRYNLAEGVSLLGGASLVNFATPGAAASGVNASGLIRYIEDASSDIRFFGEAGVQVGALGLEFSRSFYDSATISDDYDATGSGNGYLGAVFVRGGALITPMPDNEVVVSASLKQSALGISGYAEDDPDANPNLFTANLDGTTMSTTVKTGVDWTTKISEEVDLTASGHVGATFGSGVSGDVFGVGEVNGEAQSTIFAQYGLRLGWTPSPGTKVDGFVQGTTGTNIGTHAQIGAAYRMAF